MHEQPTGAQGRPRWRRRDRLGAVALAVLVAAAGLGLARAWRLPDLPGPAAMKALAPVADGAGGWFARRDGAGRVIGWESYDVRIEPPAGAVGGSGAAARLALAATLPEVTAGALVGDPAGPLGGERLVRARTLTLALDGSVTSAHTDWLLRGDGGLRLLARDEARVQWAFEPAMVVVPPEVAAGTAWAQEGTARLLPTTATLAYRVRGEVTDAGGGCAGIVRHVTIATSTTEESELRCPGEGLVRATRSTAAGTVERVERTTMPPPAAPAATVGPAGTTGPGTPRWERVARLAPPTAASTGPAGRGVVAGDTLVVGTAGGELVGLAAVTTPSAVIGSTRWRLALDGTPGRCTYDPATATVVVGTGAGTVVAVGPGGVVRWRARVGAAVVGAPAVVAGIVVVPSADGSLHAVGLDTGEPRWRVGTGGPVVADVVATDGPAPLVVAGSHDGIVRAVDARSGEVVWAHAMDGTVSALAPAGDGAVAVADGTGAVRLLGHAGTLRWSARAAGPVRAAPAVWQGMVVVVDATGGATAFDRVDGSQRWAWPGAFVAGPVAFGDALLLADATGSVVAVGAGGEALATYPAHSAPDHLGGEPAAASPGTGGGTGAVGAGAAWFVDDDGVVRLLGAAAPGPGPTLATPAWPAPAGFATTGSAPARWGDSLVAIDDEGRLVVVATATGAARLVAEVGPDPAGIAEGPGVTVAGDVAIVTVGSTVHAVGLADGSRRWKYDTGVLAFRPPPTGGGVVVVTAARVGGDAAGPVDAVGLDVATGVERWRWPLSATGAVAAADVGAGVVVLDSPPAGIEAATGALRWRATLDGAVVAGVAATAGGGALAVLATSAGGDASPALIALDATGRERWRLPLPAAVDPRHAPFVAGAHACVLTIAPALACADLASGAPRPLWSPPAPALGDAGPIDTPGRALVALAGGDGEVWFIDPGTATLAVASTGGQLGALDRSAAQRPVMAAGVVAAGAGVLVALRWPS